ncbi:MAG TPA: hypothetical protein VLA33_07070 [Gemmatimonadota bacterium]|nr:hypothetical protein [Gemmatimonadota bacterium]
MKKAAIVSISAALLIAAPLRVIAQEPAEPQEPAATQAPASERSPVLAAALSGMLWPGMGSYYAGNSGHGTVHAAIAGAAVLGMIAGSSDCSYFDPEDACELLGVSAIVFAGNWIWSIFRGVNDVKEYNRSIQRARLRVALQMVAFRSRSGPVVGVELLRFGL